MLLLSSRFDAMYVITTLNCGDEDFACTISFGFVSPARANIHPMVIDHVYTPTDAGIEGQCLTGAVANLKYADEGE